MDARDRLQAYPTVLATVLKSSPLLPHVWDPALRSIDVAEHQSRTIDAAEMRLREGLPPGGWIRLEGVRENDQLGLAVQTNAPQEIAVRGHSGATATLWPGDLLRMGRYGWVLQRYAAGQGVGLMPVDPITGASMTLRDVRVGDRLDIERLHVPAGQSVAITGRSGAGKSTLIHEIVGRRRGVGQVLIAGQSRAGAVDPAAKTIAWVPQQDLLHDDLTVRQQTASMIRLVGNRRTDAAKPDAVATRWLRAVGLGEKLDSMPDQLSGGQKRRARLAAAIGRLPGVLLLDEPDSGLDPDTATEIPRFAAHFWAARVHRGDGDPSSRRFGAIRPADCAA